MALQRQGAGGHGGDASRHVVALVRDNQNIDACQLHGLPRAAQRRVSIGLAKRLVMNETQPAFPVRNALTSDRYGAVGEDDRASCRIVDPSVNAKGSRDRKT